MLKALREIDLLVWAAMQTSYLWALDRTGIYSASVSVCLFIPASYLVFIQLNTTLSICLSPLAILSLASLGRRYALQAKGQVKKFNYMALALLKDSWIRRIVCLLTVFAIIDTASGDFIGTIGNILFILYNYSVTIFIRDRDKKPLIKLNPTLSPQEA